MLLHLELRDFAIIDSVSLALDDGLTVLSGETGAGKSILIDAIGLLLGDRADTGQVREGATQADLSAQWDLQHCPAASDWLEAQSLLDDDEPHSLTLRRVLGSDGRSRAFINGRPTPVGALRELGELLIEIHGQHAHQLLRKPGHQRQLLDDFGDYPELLARVAETAGEVQALRKRLQQVREGATTDPAQLQLLQHQVGELDALALEADELPGLEEEHRRLSHAGELLQRGGAALGALVDDDDAVRGRLAQLTGLLAQLRDLTSDFDEAAELADQARIAVDEAGSSLRHALDRIDLDPERLQTVEDRMRSIHDLARKHRVTAAELPALHERLQASLEAAEAAGGDLEALQQRLTEAEKAYGAACAPLHDARAEAADRLAQAVNEQLARLNMPDARLQVVVRAADAGGASRHGSDEVVLLFSANPGQSPQPLVRIASGGELSRVSLALQAALSARASVPVMIFDEVDVGVGGATAEVVGQLLRSLSTRCQVLCVTHLPQVAAQGHHQINVRKQVVDGRTEVRTGPLDASARAEEIARMLGGVKITRETQKLAQQMLKQAAGS